MSEKHIPVLLEEVVEFLNAKKGGIYVDGTVGYGGHAKEILEATNGEITYIGFDRDGRAIKFTQNVLSKYQQVTLVHQSYGTIPTYLMDEGIGQVDGILLDLGFSSPQVDDPKRGFSFKEDAPLDMRFDTDNQTITAVDLLKSSSEDDLAQIFKEYGEERFAKKIAHKIVEMRREYPIETTWQLADLVKMSIPKAAWPKAIHPATKVFQALRIAVNDELTILEQVLPELILSLKKGGRILVISFHSLEDRIVKNAFKKAETSCICPKEFPVCVCNKEQTIRIITKKPIISTKTKIKNNVRARSAKLRVAERV